MKPVWSMLAVALALTACATSREAPSSATAAAAPAAATEAAVDGDGKVCRREAVMGSAMVRRVCRTPEQLKAEQEAARAAMGRTGTKTPDKMPGT